MEEVKIPTKLIDEIREFDDRSIEVIIEEIVTKYIEDN